MTPIYMSTNNIDLDKLLRLYKAGERDFRNVSLRGRSLIGQNLAGADFSYGDIRGTNFTHANLSGASFSNAKAGLQPGWMTCLAIAAIGLFALSTAAATQAGIIVIGTLSPRPGLIAEFRLAPALVILVSLTVFFIATTQAGFLLGASALAITISLAVPLGGILGRAMAEMGPVALALAWVVFASLTAAIAIGLIWAIAKTQDVVKAIAIASLVSSLGAGKSAWEFTKAFAEWENGGAIGRAFHVAENGGIAAMLAVTVLTLSIVGLGGYVAWKAKTGDEKFALTQRIAVALAATRGTSFRKADLTNTNFSDASLRNTDLREAILTHTYWHQTRNLNLARVGGSYLSHARIRQLVFTSDGCQKNYDRLDLQSLNLCGANLTEASLIGTNLSQANLQGANLSNAKLVQTQLDCTDLTNACLTGACIQDWGITTTTKLEEIQCEYVYMRSPTENNPDCYRKPDNTWENFANGEFADFIAPLVKTLDLYHNRRADPRAVAIAFRRLIEEHPESELELLAIERKGRDKILLRAKAKVGANLSVLSQKYFTNYNWLRALPQNDPSLRIPEIDTKTRRLEMIVAGMPTKL
jgi:uncharacterized protein YjbI with pentapeptide repeats